MALIELSLVYMAQMRIWKEYSCGRSWWGYILLVGKSSVLGGG